MAIEWITAGDLLTPGDPLAEDSAAAASWILYRLSGQRYPGIRTATEWYGYDHASCWCNPAAEISMREHGVALVNAKQPNGQLRLRQKPVQLVTSVTDYSGERDPESYHLVNDAYLLNLNGGSWDFEGGVEVTYTYGTPPPAMGRNAAIKLGNELLAMYNDSPGCQLPARVTDINRQGVSFTIMDPADFIEKGQTGIYEIDLFLSVANPSHALKRAKVFSPDKPRGENRR